MLPSAFCFLLDAQVTVIYVSPVELNDEVYQYYNKLLGMKAQRLDRDDCGSKSTPNEEDTDNIENRYKIVVPDAVDRFPVGVLLYNIDRLIHVSFILPWTYS